MPDREKVIKAYEDFVNGYERFCASDDYVFEMHKAVLALLKEQEAVEPILVREGWNKYHNNYVCPRCDNDVFYEQNYCTECGVQFLWNGR